MELSVDAEFYGLLDLASIAKEARAEGIDLWSFHLPYYDLVGSCIAVEDESERRYAVQYQSEWIKRAAQQGFRYAVIHPSYEPIDPSERAAKKIASTASIAELALVAKENGMTLAVEDLPRSCLGNCSGELLELLSGAPDAAVCFDTNHLLSEDPLHFLDAVGERLATVHVSDYDFINERHWLPGEGKIDWNALLDKLDEIGYRGVFMYELNLGSPDTIVRDHVLTPAEIRQNADELMNRSPLTKRGRILV